jgi:hypothetical protein
MGAGTAHPPLFFAVIVIVGHGPSINVCLGHLIDRHPVVRLKHGLTKHQPREHFGTRTDYICGRSELYRPRGIPFWLFSDRSPWITYYAQFKPRPWKPSHGLSAVFCAIEHLKAREIALIGFDRVLHPCDENSQKWNDTPGPPRRWAHDQRAENECLRSLGVTIIDFAREYGSIPGL